MGELFVQESAIVSEKSKDEQQTTGSSEESWWKRKYQNRKNRKQGRLFILMMKLWRQALNTSGAMSLQQESGQINMLLKDSFGNLYEKTPDDMHHRLAREIHRIELKYKNPLPGRAYLQRS